MNSTTTRRLALPALGLAGALALAGCGGGSDDTATTGSPPSSSSSGDHGGGHGSGHSTDGGAGTAKGNDADVAFLTGMKPHHEQAVEMSDIVLAANPSAEVAALANRVKAAQSPEIEQMDTMLADLGKTGSSSGHSGGHSGGHGGGHGGMLSDADLAALKAATGADAARLYLEGMIAHHQGAIEASDAQIADGQYPPAVALAGEIRTAQQAEITEMQALLESL